MVLKIDGQRKRVFFYLPIIVGFLTCFFITAIFSYFRGVSFTNSLYFFFLLFSVMSVFILIPITLIYFRFLKLFKETVLEFRGNKCIYEFNGYEKINFNKSDVQEINVYKLPSAYKKKISFMFIDNFFIYKLVLGNGTIIYIPSILCEKLEDFFENKIIEKKKSFYSFMIDKWPKPTSPSGARMFE